MVVILILLLAIEVLACLLLKEDKDLLEELSHLGFLSYKLLHSPKVSLMRELEVQREEEFQGLGLGLELEVKVSPQQGLELQLEQEGSMQELWEL